MPDGDHQQRAATGRRPGAITILLSPADLLKRGTHFDLAIAVAVLAAAGELPAPLARRAPAFIGELTLDGRPAVGARGAAHGHRRRRPRHRPGLRARAAGQRGRPWCRAWTVLGMRSLAQVVAELRDERGARGAAGGADVRAAGCWPGAARSACEELDLADLVGLEDARYAVEVAAAGGHHLMLSGPAGVGQDQHRRADPGDPARPDRRASRWS